MQRQLLSSVAAGAAIALSATAGSAVAQSSGIHAHLNDLIADYKRPASEFGNSELAAFYEDDGFNSYLNAYPVGPLADGYSWEPGEGSSFEGPVSGLPIKAPFTNYLGLPEGRVLDNDETYKIGFAYHGKNHSWLVSLADTAVWEANRHPNVDIEVRDAEFDDAKMGQAIDTWITKDFDAIVIWPAREAPMGPPVDRAENAGIPVVTLDRRAASDQVSSEVLGNFYANGLQQGLYLNHVADGDENLILNRKPLGSTADSMRTGAFLQVIGDENYNILDSYHTNSQRSLAFDTTRNALQAHDNIDVVFNTGGAEALGALDAAKEADRLHGDNGDKMVFLANDDSREVLHEIEQGNIDMVAPYTPLLGDIGIRAAIRHIGAQEDMTSKPPQQILTPNLPMITQESMTIEGIETLTPDEWGYAYGPDPEES